MWSRSCLNSPRRCFSGLEPSLTLLLDRLQERVIYNKEVQTTAIETEPSVEYEEELRQRIYRERDLEAERAARDKELEEESVKLDEEIEQEIRGTRIPPYTVT
jgi:predicted ATPase with chaperone activity